MKSSHATILRRIASLRAWRGEDDQDAALMAEMLEEIRRLEAQKPVQPSPVQASDA